MTPRLFSGLAERYRERVKREDRRAGEIVAILFNINRDSEKVPNAIDWTDIFSEWKEEPEEQTEEEMFATMMLLTKQTEVLPA